MATAAKTEGCTCPVCQPDRGFWVKADWVICKSSLSGPVCAMWPIHVEGGKAYYVKPRGEVTDLGMKEESNGEAE